MKQYHQEKDYTCGPACLRMVLSDFGMETTEKFLENMMDTNERTGTSYDSLIKCATQKWTLYCKSGQDGTVEQLEHLTSIGWTVVVCYMLGTMPHYAIYHSNNGHHIFLRDPAFRKNHSVLPHKFLKNWKVEGKNFEKQKSVGWYAAFKK